MSNDTTHVYALKIHVNLSQQFSPILKNLCLQNQCDRSSIRTTRIHVLIFLFLFPNRTTHVITQQLAGVWLSLSLYGHWFINIWHGHWKILPATIAVCRTIVQTVHTGSTCRCFKVVSLVLKRDSSPWLETEENKMTLHWTQYSMYQWHQKKVNACKISNVGRQHLSNTANFQMSCN